MAESDPAIIFEQTPTRTNGDGLTNKVHQDISDCSNSVPVEEIRVPTGSHGGGAILAILSPGSENVNRNFEDWLARQ